MVKLMAVVNFLVALSLLAWFPALLVTPMLFDAPGSENNPILKAIAYTMLGYPVAAIAGNVYFWREYKTSSALSLVAYTAISLSGPAMLVFLFTALHFS